MRPDDSFRLFDEMTAFLSFVALFCFAALVLHFA